jgi:hypothetical protein
VSQGRSPSRWLVARLPTLRDQIRDVEEGAVDRVCDWACAQEDRKWDQRDVSRDRIADRSEQVAGFELVHEQARVICGQGGGQSIDGVCNRQQRRIISRKRAGEIVDKISQWRKQGRVGKREIAAEQRLGQLL